KNLLNLYGNFLVENKELFMMEEIVIISAVRTPIGKFGGSLKYHSARMLGSIVVKEAIKSAHIEQSEVDQGIFGQVLQAGVGQNVARQILVDAGVPYDKPAMTINEVCGSGLKAVILGSQQIQLNQAEIVVVGGVESMSNAPHLLPSYRFERELDQGKLIDSMIYDDLTYVFSQKHMSLTTDKLPKQSNVAIF